jgi:hypothetical protein
VFDRRIDTSLQLGVDPLDPGKGNIPTSRRTPLLDVMAVDLIDGFVFKGFELSLQGFYYFIRGDAMLFRIGLVVLIDVVE